VGGAIVTLRSEETGATRSVTNSAGIIQYIDQTTRDKFVPTAAAEIGNTGRNFFNLASTFGMDSVSKRFWFGE
jgi:hypothetical protein